MTLFQPYRIASALLLAFSLVGCSGSGGFAGGSKSSEGKDDDKEGDQADEPTEVAGAFLTCTYIQDPAFGCTVFKKKGEPLPKADYQFDMKLFNDAEEEVAIKTSMAPDASEYHVIGNLPSAFHDNGKIQVTAKGITGEATAMQVELPTKDIQEQPLGNHLSDEDPAAFQSTTNVDPVKLTALSLKNFKVMKSWTPAKPGSVISAMAVESKTAVPSNFCMSGQIQTQLSADAQILSTGVANMFKNEENPSSIGDTNMKILDLPEGATSIGTDTNICFKKFSNSLFKGETALAHIGSGCIFVWGAIRQGEFLFIGQEMQDGKKIGTDELRALANAMNDRPGCK